MDGVRHLSASEQLITYINRAKENQNLSPDFLLIVLGPTASGKTKLAVRLAEHLNGEVISADSRQVYKGLDIGTGKDLAEYGNIPYHLIDIRDPGAAYSANLFRQDFNLAYQAIRKKCKQAILCGGSGSYIQAILQDQPYSNIPANSDFHSDMASRDLNSLISYLRSLEVPENFSIDFSNKKRVIRAIEIAEFLQHNQLPEIKVKTIKEYLIIGLQPDREQRRQAIDSRLIQRLNEGLIEEVQHLLSKGLSHDQIEWFGLEYKYVSYYLRGTLSRGQFIEKLRTEIHRFAKRQMTYFRKMEKDGICIHWFNPVSLFQMS